MVDDPAEHRALLVDLRRAQARLAGLRMRVLAAADSSDVAAESAATSTAGWVAERTRQDRSSAHADLGLGRSLDEAFVATRDALDEGLVDVAQARVMVRSVESLPANVGAQDRERAEKHLVTLVGSHDASELKRRGSGRRISR